MVFGICFWWSDLEESCYKLYWSNVIWLGWISASSLQRVKGYLMSIDDCANADQVISILFALNAIIRVSIKCQTNCCRVKKFWFTKNKWIHKISNLCIFWLVNVVQCCTSVYNNNINCRISFRYFNLNFSTLLYFLWICLLI